ncbi:hypothetical protein [Lentzea sp. NPDC055074]
MIRLVVVCNYDTTTAIALISSKGLVGTLVGGLASMLPVYLPAAVVVLLVFRQWTLASFVLLATLLLAPLDKPVLDAASSLRDSVTRVFGTLTGQGHYMVWHRHYYWYVLCAVLCVLIAWTIPPDRLAKRVLTERSANSGSESEEERKKAEDSIWRQNHRSKDISAAYGLLVALVTTSVMLALVKMYSVPLEPSMASRALRQLWLPAEEISLRSGKVEVGYVLSTADKWFAVLNEKDRRVVYILADDIVGRRTCSLDDFAKPEVRRAIQVAQGNVVKLHRCST